MGDSFPRSLSREEQEELAQSKKKVKDVNHMGFQGGQEVGLDLPSSGQGAWSGSASFKDKLVGEILGAFSQAFCFGDNMDEEVVSDEEVETIREGLAAVRFPRELKQQIRTPWTKALIVKVYGRTVGFNFLHNRLLVMWKPAGRLDCVGLGNGFFLTRLSLREDLLIGKFKQQVCYEGIQKLCFSCGRIGHRKEVCPYTILPSLASKEERTVVAGAVDGH
nr:hypothetical protein CFP56_39928 [Quercus suber]